MNRPKLLDLFCCEGGAAVGYARAGFDVYGVDNDPKVAKRYPYAIHIGDALGVLRRLNAGMGEDFRHPDGTMERLSLYWRRVAGLWRESWVLLDNGGGMREISLFEADRRIDGDWPNVRKGVS